MVHIRAIHAQSGRSYGRPRMIEELRAVGLSRERIVALDV